MRRDITRRGLLLGACALVAGCGTVVRLRQGLEFAVVNERLMMRGEVIGRTAGAFADVLEQNPQIRTVVLQDMRGDHDSAAVRAIGFAIRAGGLNTALQSDSVVQGAAVELFLSGVQRSMVEGAQIGLVARAADSASRQYHIDMLGAAQFYGFSLQTVASNGIHLMTEDEIARYGLLTEPVQRFEQ